MTPYVSLCNPGYGIAAESVFVNSTLTSWTWGNGGTQCPDTSLHTVSLNLGNNTFTVTACSAAGGGNRGSCGSAGVGNDTYYDNVQVTPHVTNSFNGGVSYDTSVVFTITNYQSSSGTFNLTTTCTGSGVSNCVNRLGSSKTIGGNSSVPDTVKFNTGSLGTTGTVQVKAVYSSNSSGVDSGYVNVTAQWTMFSTSTAYTNQEDQDWSRCVHACFAAVTSLSTVPYISKDVARSVSFTYNGDQLAPRPIVMVDVTFHSAAYTITDLQLQVQLNGTTWARFTNGQDTLHFSPDSLASHLNTPYRIGGQFDDTVLAYSNASVPMKIVVTAIFNDNQGTGSGTEQVVDSTHFLSVNRSWTAGYPRGWTLADYSRLYYEYDDSSTYIAVGEGDGSVRIYGPRSGTCSTNTTCSWTGISRAVTDTLLLIHNHSTIERHFIDGSKWLYNRNNQGAIQYRISRLGDTVYYGYKTGTLQIDTITDPYRLYSGNHTYTALKYNSSGLLDSIVEPGPYPTNVPGAGRVTALTVNPSDSTLTKWTDPDLISTSFVYDGAHRLIYAVDRRGDTTKYVYATDSSWKLNKMISPAVPIDATSSGSPTTQPDTVTFQAWQTAGVPHTATSASSPFLPVATSAVIATVTDAQHNTTTFTPDAWGQALLTVDALNDTTSVTRDSAGYPHSISYPTGGLDQFNYSLGRLTYKQSSGGTPVYYRYGMGSQLDSVYGTHRSTVIFYLSATNGRTDSSRVNTDAAKTVYKYDGYQRVDTMTDNAGHTTVNAYDATTGNRSGTTQLYSGQTQSITFDRYGRDSVVTIGSNPATTTLYDSLNRVISLNDGVHPTPTKTYYDALFVDSLSDPKGQTWRVVSNALGWATARIDARGDTAKYTYTADGWPATVKNRRGQLMTYRYDALGRLLAKHDPAAADSSTYAYSINRTRSITVAQDSVETDSTYAGPSGWVDSVKTVIIGTAGGNKVFTQHYNQTDRHQLAADTMKSTSPNFTWAQTRFVWDTLTGMRDSTFINSTPLRHHYTVEYVGDSTIYPLNVVQLDSVGSMESHQRSATHYMRSGSTFTMLDTTFSRAYTYDNSGRLQEEDETVLTGGKYVQQFLFDGLGDIIWEGFFTATSTWHCDPNKSCYQNVNLSMYDDVNVSYDSAGNMTKSVDSTGGTTTAKYQTGNQDTTWSAPSHDTLSYLYDLDGNRIQRVGPGGKTRFGWSADGRLLADTSGAHVVQFRYNASGLLVRRMIGSVRTYFIWDRGNLRAELDSTGTNRINEYVHGMGTDQPLGRITGPTGNDTVHFYARDAVGNILGQFRDTTLEENLFYDPWGKVTSVYTKITGDTTRLRFKGLYWEGDSTQLYYVRARWYDPVSRRFVSQDPAGAGANAYTFAAGDPINGSDPTGMACQDDGDMICGDAGGGDDSGDDTGTPSAQASNGGDATCSSDGSQCAPDTSTPNNQTDDNSQAGCQGMSSAECSVAIQAATDLSNTQDPLQICSALGTAALQGLNNPSQTASISGVKGPLFDQNGAPAGALTARTGSRSAVNPGPIPNSGAYTPISWTTQMTPQSFGPDPDHPSYSETFNTIAHEMSHAIYGTSDSGNESAANVAGYCAANSQGHVTALQ